VHGITVHPCALDHKGLYKGCEGEIPHFFMVFLSLLLFPQDFSLLSHAFLLLLRWRRVGEGAAARRPAVTGGAAAAVTTSFLYFFSIF